MKKIIRLSILFVLTFSLFNPVFAQESQPGGPTYIVQAGDTLWTIARNLHISYDELLAVNQLTGESNIIPGKELEIPGLGDISGVLSIVNVTSNYTSHASIRYLVGSA